jgi:hypothetical protein
LKESEEEKLTQEQQNPKQTVKVPKIVLKIKSQKKQPFLYYMVQKATKDNLRVTDRKCEVLFSRILFLEYKRISEKEGDQVIIYFGYINEKGITIATREYFKINYSLEIGNLDSKMVGKIFILFIEYNLKLLELKADGEQAIFNKLEYLYLNLNNSNYLKSMLMDRHIAAKYKEIVKAYISFLEGKNLKIS